MSQKIVQYLNEAHASETALVRVLQEQVAMTPRGPYRGAIESHLTETRSHARRIEQRLSELGEGANPLQFVVGLAESVVGQALALGKTPLDLLRGNGGNEKVLKNAKDTAATEALEIATYTALERLAQRHGDEQTARLAASIRADEERMLARVLEEIPRLTDAVDGDTEFDVASTGVGEAVQAAAKLSEAREEGSEGSADELPIARYDELSAEEIVGRLPELSQADLARLDGYERMNLAREPILDRINGLRALEPWPGYDDLNVREIRDALPGTDPETLEDVRRYERAHKDRASVLRAAEQQLTAA
jgi:ferritin-like metal-binding protein YciE